MSNNREFLWVEKYRPQTVQDCILPKRIKDVFAGIVKQGQIPNLLLTGKAGTGKTTIARAMCNDLDCDHILINGSDERNLDTIRGKIKQFASTVSLDGNNGQRKIVILDEADNLNPDAQKALRALIEEFSSNCGFIFTCNYKNRIINPIHSRCSVIDFQIFEEEKKQTMVQFAKSCFSILSSESVDYSKESVLLLLKRYYPDFRRTINELQRYATINNNIDEGVLSQGSDANMTDLIKALKSKNYDDLRMWVVNNISNDPAVIYSQIYNNIREHMDKQNYPAAVLILADYQYKSAFSSDEELNLLACLTEILVNCEMK